MFYVIYFGNKKDIMIVATKMQRDKAVRKLKKKYSLVTTTKQKVFFGYNL